MNVVWRRMGDEVRRAALDTEGEGRCHYGGMQHSPGDPLPELNKYFINATTPKRMDSIQDFDTVRITLRRLVSLVALLPS